MQTGPCHREREAPLWAVARPQKGHGPLSSQLEWHQVCGGGGGTPPPAAPANANAFSYIQERGENVKMCLVESTFIQY